MKTYSHTVLLLKHHASLVLMMYNLKIQEIIHTHFLKMIMVIPQEMHHQVMISTLETISLHWDYLPQGCHNPKKLSENEKRSNWNDTQVPDVLRDHFSSDSNEEDPPRSQI